MTGGFCGGAAVAVMQALALLALVSGCASGGNSGSSPSTPPETTGASPETTAAAGEPREPRVEQLSSGAPGQGPKRPRVILAPSAAALSGAIGARVPDSGEGTYLAAYWGEKPTGGYSLAVHSARLEGDLVTVQLSLREPPPGAMVTQALTYPYAVAFVGGLESGDEEFAFVGRDGRELGWPVRRVSG